VYIKSWPIWNVIRYRFKIKLHPTCELASTRDSPLVFALSPHGILPLGLMFAFFSNVAGVKQVLPKVDVRCLAASFCFYIPLYRDLLLAGGVCDAARYNARYLLKAGYTLALVPGGATEALYAGIGRHTLYVNKRLGFVRLAMQCGARIVPVYGFGETNSYNVLQTQNYYLRAFQRKWQRIFGISLPLVTHIVPRYTKVDVVIGEPLAVPHKANPTDEEVIAVLEQYKAALSKLWHAHKDQFAKDRIEELTFV